MNKLIVEEAGQRRQFKIGQGTLTVGSGAEARLKLSSSDVADVHLEVEVREDGLLVRARPGVLPPRVHGVAFSGEKMLVPGEKLSLGSATLWLESENARAKVSPGEAVPRKKSVVRARKRTVKKGAPTWAVVSIVVTVGLVGLLILQKLLSESAAHEAGGMRGTIHAIRGHIDASQHDLALEKIRAARPDASIEERAVLDSFEREIRENLDAAQLVIDQGVGSRWMHTYLDNYEERYMEGKEPEPHVVRLFVKRLHEFKRRWPKHPKNEWVDRQLARQRGAVDLDAPPTWEDVAWEVRMMGLSKPRNYVEAFRVLESMYGKLDSSNEELELEARILKLEEERAEYHLERLRRAEDEYKKHGDAGKAVWWLVHDIIWIDDEGMADESAGILVKMPNVEGHLRGYKEKYPDRLDLVLRNGVVNAWAQKTGFVP